MERKKLTLKIGDAKKVAQKIEAFKNPKPTNPKKLNAEIIDWLIHAFPKCFSMERDIPFKRKIEHDLAAASEEQGKLYTKKEIEKALSFYSHHANYLQTILDSTHRVDLEGNPDEEIFDVHKVYAQKRLHRLAKKKFKPKPKRN